MLISLIAAIDQAGGIGRDGRLPWRLHADLQRFKALTMGHFLIVGRKTYDSIGRPLPGRRMVVISRQPGLQAAGCQVAASLQAALRLADAAGETEAFIGGGGQIYAQALPLAGCLYLTRVQTTAGCDAFFPAFDPAEWLEVQRADHPADDRNDFPATFQKLVRRHRP